MTANQIHGHEVINIVSAHPQGISVADLGETLAAQFGEGARFFTCSAENMDLAALLLFLEARDKVRLDGDTIFPGGSGACQH